MAYNAEWQKQYRAARKKETAQYLATWRQNNREKINAYQRARRKKYPAQFRDKDKRWRANNPGYQSSRQKRLRNAYRHYNETRRARKLAAEGICSLAQWLWRVEFYGWRCAYCACSLTEDTLTQDHMIPLSRGGSQWPSNLVPACQACNSRKHDKTYKEFLSA